MKALLQSRARFGVAITINYIVKLIKSFEFEFKISLRLKKEEEILTDKYSKIG